MEKLRTVVLYGSDLVVSTVYANLYGRVGFQVLQIDPLHPEAVQRLDAARPDVVLFDLADPPPDFAVAVLRKHPGLILMGVDLKSGKMLVMSGAESRLLTADDLVQMMDGVESRIRDGSMGNSRSQENAL
jgi:hypothetical protein